MADRVSPTLLRCIAAKAKARRHQAAQALTRRLPPATAALGFVALGRAVRVMGEAPQRAGDHPHRAGLAILAGGLTRMLADAW